MDDNLLPPQVFWLSSISRIRCPSGLPPRNQLSKLKGSINGSVGLLKHHIIKLFFYLCTTIHRFRSVKAISNKTTIFP